MPVEEQEILSGLGVIAAAGIAYLARALKHSKKRAPEQLARQKAIVAEQKRLGLRVTKQEERIAALERIVTAQKPSFPTGKITLEENS